MFLYFVLLFLAASTTICGGTFSKSHIREAEHDLRDATQMRCAAKAEYITIDTTVTYIDQTTKKGSMDYILEERGKETNVSSRVVLAIYPDYLFADYYALPVTVTGTNIGIGVGMTNNTPQAFIFGRKKRIKEQFTLRHYNQNASFCAHISQIAELGLSSFYRHRRNDYKQPYVTVLNTALLHPDGFVATNCGYIHNRLGCFNRVLRPSRIWRTNITSAIKRSSFRSEQNAWQSVETLSAALGGNIPIYDEVFVIDSIYDYNYHHMLVDSIGRLIPFYHYLKRHPHIKIHIRQGESVLNGSYPVLAKMITVGPLIRRRIFDLLGFEPDRIMHGTLLARKLYLPNDMECVSPLRHALELQQLSKLLQMLASKEIKLGACKDQSTPARRLAGRSPSRTASKPKKSNTMQSSPEKGNNPSSAVVLPAKRATVIIQVRGCSFVTPANETRTDWRCLTDTQIQQLERATKEVFPQSKVVLATTTLSTSLACDIALYRTAHTVIGLHGAAMTNIMFMRPGTVLAEVVGQYDLRMPPVCGFHGPYGSVFGIHHYQYYYDGVLDADALNILDMVKQAYKFYTNIRMQAGYTDYSLAHGRFDYNVTIVN